MGKETQDAEGPDLSARACTRVRGGNAASSSSTDGVHPFPLLCGDLWRPGRHQSSLGGAWGAGSPGPRLLLGEK